jgi:hypothetical protein
LFHRVVRVSTWTKLVIDLRAGLPFLLPEWGRSRVARSTAPLSFINCVELSHRPLIKKGIGEDLKTDFRSMRLVAAFGSIVSRLSSWVDPGRRNHQFEGRTLPFTILAITMAKCHEWQFVGLHPPFKCSCLLTYQSSHWRINHWRNYNTNTYSSSNLISRKGWFDSNVVSVKPLIIWLDDFLMNFLGLYKPITRFTYSIHHSTWKKKEKMKNEIPVSKCRGYFHPKIC